MTSRERQKRKTGSGWTQVPDLTHAPALPTMTAKERISRAARQVQNGTLAPKQRQETQPFLWSMGQKAAQSPTLPLAAERTFEPKTMPTSKSDNGTTFSPASSYLTGGSYTPPAPYAAGLQERQAREQSVAPVTPQTAQTSAPKPTVQKTDPKRRALDAAIAYQRARGAQRRAAKTQRLAQLDIGAAKGELATLEEEWKQRETAFLEAQKAQIIPMDILYRDGRAAYDAAQAAANKNADTAWAEFEAAGAAVTKKREEIERASDVQLSLAPARSDFKEYAAKGAAIQNPSLGEADRGLFSKKPANVVTFARENKEAIEELLAGSDQDDSSARSLTRFYMYNFLTDEEADVYNYYLGKGDEASASRYLQVMEEELNRRWGSSMADNFQSLGPVGKAVAAAGLSFSSGREQNLRGLKQAFTEERLPTSATQFLASDVWNSLGEVGPEVFGRSSGQVAFDVGNMIGNMTNSVAAGMVGGPGAAAGVTFLSSGGNAYGEALAQGYSKEEARAYGILSGASEAGLQYVLSGISSLGGKLPNSEVVQSALNNIKNAALRIPAKYAVAAVGEMTEEYLQEILTPVFRNLALGENNEFKLFTEDAAYAALLAALSVGALEGPRIVGADIKLDRVGQTLRGQWGGDTSGVIDVLIHLGLNQEQDTDAYQAALAAKKQLDSRGTVTDVTLGTLYNSVMSGFEVEGQNNGDLGPHLTVKITEDIATSDKRKIRNLIPATVTQLTTFIKNALQGKNTLQYIKVSDVDPTLIKVVKQQFDIDITGFSHVLKDNDIRHINKSHGEMSSDKYKVTVDMLANVQNVIENYDTIYLGYDTKDGHQTIVYEKKDGTRTFYVEEVLEEGGLSSKQMIVVGENSKPSFLKKYKKAINRTSDTDVATSSRTTSDSSPGNHVQDAESPVDFISIIPQTPPEVNLQASAPTGKVSDLEVLRKLAEEMARESIRRGDLGPVPEIPPRPVQPSAQEILSRLAWEMAMDPQTRAIPMRPVQPSAQEILSRLAREMAMDPQTRAIPQRPVQQSPQEILSRLAWEMTQDPGDSLAALSDEDIRAMLDEIARGQGGETMPTELNPDEMEEESVEKYKAIRYHRDGRIVVTDDWTHKEHVRIPPSYRPNAVIDTISRGTQKDRTIYGADAKIKTQIHGGDHGQPKRHPYGAHGEHAHDYTWRPGAKEPNKPAREISLEERIRHRDILGVDDNDRNTI